MRTGKSLPLWVLVVLSSIWAFRAECADFMVQIYQGMATTKDARVRLTAPATPMPATEFSGADRRSEGPLYHPVTRLAWWPRATWGIAIDFTHTKRYADNLRRHMETALDGRRNDLREALHDAVTRLRMPLGHKVVTVNGVYRWAAQAGVQPYAVLGAGLVIPPAEVRRDDSKTEEYHFVAQAIQALGGLDLRLTERLALFLEYKAHYAKLKLEPDNSETVEIKPLTHRFFLGLTYTFP